MVLVLAVLKGRWTLFGTDYSVSFEYRPVLNNNVIIIGGLSTLVPGGGFRQLYNRQDGKVNPLVAGFLEVALTY